MTLLRGISTSAVVALLAVAAAPHPLPAQEPEKQDLPVFEVRLVDDDGKERESFGSQSLVHAEMHFVLALSASGHYATSVTAIENFDGRIREKVLYEGRLTEGFYRYRAEIGRPPGAGGEVGIKIILKTRIFPKKFTGESYYVYRSWEGSYSTVN